MSKTHKDYMAKAGRALEEARVLLKVGGYEGACNRAYYAMFDAAHAALLGSGVAEKSPETHSGLIAAFGLKLVRSGLIQPEFGRALRQVESLRGIADYGVEAIVADKALWAVGQAEDFVGMVRQLLARDLTQKPEDPEPPSTPGIDI
ncbi:MULTISPECIES: HEPN domain-containing protein [unclassified Burkholderia]|uniref:HEPN domain-containing protein n=1 Tax=unclassified Burkholderia TaxID=2613784 RepID=UPI002AB18D30|nr:MULTISPECIES: HEPN domain-containing protein [unclassified Burkholderia]